MNMTISRRAILGGLAAATTVAAPSAAAAAGPTPVSAAIAAHAVAREAFADAIEASEEAERIYLNLRTPNFCTLPFGVGRAEMLDGSLEAIARSEFATLRNCAQALRSRGMRAIVAPVEAVIAAEEIRIAGEIAAMHAREKQERTRLGYEQAMELQEAAMEAEEAALDALIKIRPATVDEVREKANYLADILEYLGDRELDMLRDIAGAIDA